MASISTNKKNQFKTIQFTATDGRRRSIRLGKISKREALSIKLRIESLISSIQSGCPWLPETAEWIANLPDTMANKLAATGLIPKREPPQTVLVKSFIESYISRRSDVSHATQQIWKQACCRLVKYFGSDKKLNEITKGEAADWRLSLISEGLSDASVRTHSGFAKFFFKQAVEHELIDKNPFEKLVSSPVGNDSRQRFITREDIQKVFDACPNSQWRLIVALSRYGGLRCPSEHLELKWSDIDWANNEIIVRSPKTKKHAGHEQRIIPLFFELKLFLDESWEGAKKGQEHLITIYRKPDSNLRTEMIKIVQRAGLEVWPRIFHNLRASRATELAAKFADHVAAGWLGHSPAIANKHYRTITDTDFERATSQDNQSGAKSGAVNGEVMQKAVQTVPANNSQELHESKSSTNAQGPGVAW